MTGRSLGIDLAAQTAKTWACVITWSDAGRIRDITFFPRMTDDALLDLMADGAPTGIDAPFGWPQAFTAALAAFHADGSWVEGQAVGEDEGWSRALRLRATDRAIYDTLRLTPLSVSASNLAVCAFRAAGILSRWCHDSGRELDRTGEGTGIYEVYPAAALSNWGLPFRRYKRLREGRTVREAIVDRLSQALSEPPALAGTAEPRLQMAGVDHALDAFISALVARLAALGHTRWPAVEEMKAARAEGWIHVPTGALAQLSFVLRR